jgi:hypothetical protein
MYNFDYALLQYLSNFSFSRQDKQIRYTPRKPKNDVRKRGNG